MASNVEAVARERIKAAHNEILNSLRHAANGNPFAAEPDSQRMHERLQAKARLSHREASSVAKTIERTAGATDPVTAAEVNDETHDELFRAAKPTSPGAEKVWGDSIDFVNVGFLALGARTARSVGRVAYRNGRPRGSGFLIGEGLFLTNNHVIGNPESARDLVLEFDYELDFQGSPRAITRFAIDTSVFVTDPVSGLDFTILGVGPIILGDTPLTAFGWSPLSDASDKHMLGEFANIVQHPQGRFKEVVLRENRLVSRFDDALHYVADTEPGSSGSPVYNSEWRVIALHHWGGPWIQKVDDQGRPLALEINEGIRISAIVGNVIARQATLSPSVWARLVTALNIGDPPSLSDALSPVLEQENAGHLSKSSSWISTDGRVHWTVPVEISVRIPGLNPSEIQTTAQPVSAAASVPAQPNISLSETRPNKDYGDRQGYKPNFISGHRVRLPRLSETMTEIAAINKLAEPGDDKHELRYHHFSLAINRSRKLAFFTACNINGATAKSIKRGTDLVSPLRPDSAGLESLSDMLGAEASDSWYDDDRLDKSDYARKDIYSGQRVPGFPNPRSRGRIARMFQRGHLVRRLDPAWGTDRMALAAEADTFHWTNCSPQVGFFNQGTADRDMPGTGGGRLWRSVENYVLRNAVATDQRVTCFTGPIFDDVNDRPYRSIKVPGRFFKIAVWAEEDDLRALAMIADQRQVFDTWPEAIWSESITGLTEEEAFMEPNELDKVEDFLSSIAEIESLTKLDFGSSMRAADVRIDAEHLKIQDTAEIPLKPEKAKSSRRSRRKK